MDDPSCNWTNLRNFDELLVLDHPQECKENSCSASEGFDWDLEQIYQPSYDLCSKKLDRFSCA